MRRRLLPRLRDLARDRSGAIAPLAALTFVVVTGFAALAVDTGSFYYGRKRQQAATDLAALSAASDIAAAERAAASTLQANGFASGDLRLIETGIYTADPKRAPASRFVPARAGANAVRVSTRSTLPVYLSRMFLAEGGVTIESRATATRNDVASFALGSRLAALEGGIANAILGALLGTRVGLTLADYQALAGARIDLLAFSGALATRIDASAASFDTLAASRVRVGDVLSAALDTARGAGASPAAQAALGQIARAKLASSDALAFGSLLDLGPFAKGSVSSRPVAASASLLDLVTAAAQVANGARQADVALALDLPSLATATLKIAIGERPVGGSAFAVGPERTTVRTAQVRFLLVAKLGGTGLVPSVSLPLLLELAQSEAQLSAISCPRTDPRAGSATLAVTPGLAEGWIGAVDPGVFGSSSTPNPGPATLVDLAGIATVKGRAHARIADMRPVSLVFGPAEIQAGTKKTTSTTDFTASLLSSLMRDLTLEATMLGLGLQTPAVLRSDTAAAVAAAAPALDILVNRVLATLGLGLGQADTWVGGVRCGTAVLVD